MGSLRDEIDQLLVTDSMKRLSDTEDYGGINISQTGHTHDGNVSDDDPTLGTLTTPSGSVLSISSLGEPSTSEFYHSQ